MNTNLESFSLSSIKFVNIISKQKTNYKINSRANQLNNNNQRP